MERRLFLKNCIATGAAGLAIGTGLLTPASALTQEFDASQAGSVDEVLQALGITATESSDQIRIRAPSIAEDGATVPVGVTSTIGGTTEIITLVSENPKPLAARYQFGKGATAAVEARLKMGQTTDVIAVVKADGRYYTAKTQVKVTRSGCGG